MNRIEIKEKAKEILKDNFKEFWAGYLIVLAISFLCTFGIDLLFDKGSVIYACLSLVVSFFTSTLSVGLYSYMLKMVREDNYDKEDIFKYVGDVLPIAVISFLMMICVFLWSILFIIPGIIAAISYTMVFYIYADSEEKLEPMDYLNKSKELMSGYKWDYFVFCLSFLGWVLLSVITLGLGLIYTIPYVCISQTIYYNELKSLKEKE